MYSEHKPNPELLEKQSTSQEILLPFTLGKLFGNPVSVIGGILVPGYFYGSVANHARPVCHCGPVEYPSTRDHRYSISR